MSLVACKTVGNCIIATKLKKVKAGIHDMTFAMICSLEELTLVAECQSLYDEHKFSFFLLQALIPCCLGVLNVFDILSRF